MHTDTMPASGRADHAVVSQPKVGRPKLQGIQILRALAATVVMVAHASRELTSLPYSHYTDPLRIWHVGQSGVDLFFVISGFIMVYVSNRENTAAVFAKKRAIRILPVYWFYSSLILGIIFLSPSLKRHTSHSISYIVASYLCVPWPRPLDGAIEPVFQLGWTLNYEVFFYAVFALMLLFFKQRGRKYVLGMMPLLAMMGFFVSRTTPQLWYWTRPIILEFSIGGLIAFAYLKGFRLPRIASVGSIILGLSAVLATGAFQGRSLDARALFWGLPFALVFAGTVLPEPREVGEHQPRLFRRWISAGLVAVGDSSYSLYLCHMFIVRIETALLPKHALGSWYWVVYLGLLFPVGYGVAWTSYIYIEKNFARVLSNYWQGASPALTTK